MKYAKSILLAGEYIDAETATYDDYKDLLMTCPCCESPVFLCKGFDRHYKSGKVVKILSTWKHYSDRGVEGIAECEARSQYRPQDVEQRNTVARKQRFKLYRTRLWDLIALSPFVKGLETEKHIRTLLEDGVTHWFVNRASKCFRDERIFPDIYSEIDMRCNHALNNIPKKDKLSTYDEALIAILRDSNLEYRKQIAAEAMKFCFRNYSGNDLKKLTAFAMPETLHKDILRWTEYLIEGLIEDAPLRIQSEIIEMYNSTPGKVMELIEGSVGGNEITKNKFANALSGLVHDLFGNMAGLFLSIPWLEELKKSSSKLRD
ncbi:MAG: hypothetical protein QNJ68_03500 [Microcoleaceae cyanobacterium MO_207.B10]|nr:hypothetical protein [Microcoleaceae cyanobacterium MO_207.B10]